jgi:hypothetical protein
MSDKFIIEEEELKIILNHQDMIFIIYFVGAKFLWVNQVEQSEFHFVGLSHIKKTNYLDFVLIIVEKII